MCECVDGVANENACMCVMLKRVIWGVWEGNWEGL